MRDARTLLGREPDVDAVRWEAAKLYDEKNYTAALPAALKAEAIAKARFGTNHKPYAEALVVLAKVYEKLELLEEAAESFAHALLIFQVPFYADDYRSIVETFAMLGDVLRLLRKYDEARACYDRALAILKTSLTAKDRRMLVDTLSGLAGVHRTQGNIAAAREHYERALAITARFEMFKENEQGAADILDDLASLC